MKTVTLMTALTALGLSACGDDAGTAPGALPPANSAAPAASGAPAPVVEALRCWGLTHGASVLHLAAPDLATDLPQVSIPEYTAWFNEALRRAAAAGMTRTEFAELQTEFQMSNRFATRAELREESVEPINACLAQLPPNTSEPPQLPET